MHEKNLLSEILFHINIFTLIEEPLIISAMEQYKLINPVIYSQIKTMKEGQIDYFKPIKYLYELFHKDFCKDKDNKLFETEYDRNIKEVYYKLILENDIKYYNEEISVYYEFLGHKILWYCNKCLLGEEFHTENKISKNAFSKVVKKIFIFFTIKDIMEEFLEFDSYILLTLIFPLLSIIISEIRKQKIIIL